MLRTMAELLGEVCSVTRRLLRLKSQTSMRVNVFFPAKGRILFEHATYRRISDEKSLFTLSETKPGPPSGDTPTKAAAIVQTEPTQHNSLDRLQTRK